MPEIINGVKTILVVEDTPSHCEMVAYELRRRYDLTLAADHETAEDRVFARRTPFDLVILDSKIPRQKGGDDSLEEGFSFLEGLRQKSDVPVILVTSAPINQRARTSYTQLGVVKIFEKPFSLIELGELVDELVA